MNTQMDTSITIIEKIEKNVDKWKINLIKDLDLIIIKIENDFTIYESTFYLNDLQSLLSSKYSIDEMIKYLFNYIDDNKIRIEENEKYLKLILLNNSGNIELIIKEKNKLSEEIIKKLIEEIKNLKENNKKLELRIKNIEKEKGKERNKNEEKIKENKMNEIENRIKNLEKYINKKHIQLTHCNLKKINSISPHYESINSILSFPSGNIISVSADKSIKIYDNNFNIIQDILNAHDDNIFDVSIKDENNFVTCSKDKAIKIWNKKKIKRIFKDEYSFILYQIINNAHDDSIYKVIYCSNGNIISCSSDKKIKIWEENNGYNCNKILKHNDWIVSILLLEDKNILISSGGEGTNFWNLNNYENIYTQKILCWNRNALKRIDENRIIFGGDYEGIIKIVLINENEIIKEIKNDFLCKGICIIENKGIFLIGGESKKIKIYRNDNYQCIKIIKEAHNNYIYGINQLKYDSIASYGEDNIINVWSF